jgi:carboxypeptidase Taq
MNETYRKFTNLWTEIRVLEGIEDHLDWDQKVCLSANGYQLRQNQNIVLAGLLHEKYTSSQLGEILETLSSDQNLSEEEKRNVALAQKKWKQKAGLTRRQAESKAALTARGYEAWLKAKQEENFSLFAPVLKEWLDWKLEVYSSLYPDADLYSSAMQEFEDGLTTEIVDSCLEPLRIGLPALIEEFSESYAPFRAFPQPHATRSQLDGFFSALAGSMGFDFDMGRIDTSPHPFTGGAGPTDVRFTVQPGNKSSFQSLIGALVHEAGHALYDQGRNSLEPMFMPVNDALGMVIHESQSLLWERNVAGEPAFFRHLLPALAELGFSRDQLSPVALCRSFNCPKPDFIRVDADEVTYPMHILIRYDCEKALFNGKITVHELEDFFNTSMKAYLGITPDRPSMGVLQDVHWSEGDMGYFPCYTIGAIFGAAMYSAAINDLGSASNFISKQGLLPLTHWLRTNVHEKGSRADAFSLIRNICGAVPDGQFYLSYLREKYRMLLEAADEPEAVKSHLW